MGDVTRNWCFGFSLFLEGRILRVVGSGGFAQILLERSCGIQGVTDFAETQRALLPQNLLHRLALGELVDQLVQKAYFLHEWIVDVFDADTADDAFDQ